MATEKYSVGIDFGTESARAVLVNVATGEEMETAVYPYDDGVIDEFLPNTGIALPPLWALQNPLDWLTTLEQTVRAIMAEASVDPVSVIGIGLDFTSCTVLPTTADGTPLCLLDLWRRQPHAWPKLWKHHAAQPYADRINEVAAVRGEKWLARYGSKISSEWLLPKALQMLVEAPGVYAAADRIVEGADWMVWQMTGRLVRNACAAGYKATWHKRDGFPSSDFLTTLHSGLATLYTDKLKGPILPPGALAGRLRAEWAERLGLASGTAVAVPIIDAHAAVPGGGVTEPGSMFMIMGTSTCHMVMAEAEVPVEGICGVVEDGIVPGWFAYEAGQASVGDIFAWFIRYNVPLAYQDEARSRGLPVHEIFTEKAARLKPGQTGLLALDWWNGCRSTLVDADLSGLVMGYTLGTRAEDIYRALIEATAYGTRVIIDAFTDHGIAVDRIVAGGGLTQNQMLMQIYADVTGLPLREAGTSQPSALGATILGAVAGGRNGGGYNSLAEAAKRMAPPPRRVYEPILAGRPIYDVLYTEYRRLYDSFGRDPNSTLKVLRRIRSRVESEVA